MTRIVVNGARSLARPSRNRRLLLTMLMGTIPAASPGRSSPVISTDRLSEHCIKPIYPAHPPASHLDQDPRQAIVVLGDDARLLARRVASPPATQLAAADACVAREDLHSWHVVTGDACRQHRRVRFINVIATGRHGTGCLSNHLEFV